MVFGPRHSIKLSGRIYSLGEIAGKKKKAHSKLFLFHSQAYIVYVRSESNSCICG